MMYALIKRGKIFLLVILGSSLVLSCYEFPEVLDHEREIVTEADLARVVIVGDSYLSGFMDGSLYTDGQQNSSGAILNRALKGEELVQSKAESANGLNLFFSPTQVLGKFELVFFDKNASSPEVLTTIGEVPKIQSSVNPDLIMDLTVPGLRITDCNRDDLGDANYYFNGIQTDNETNYLEEITKREPTFLLIHIGTDDILQYVFSGATGDFNATNPIWGDATNVEQFELSLSILLESILTESNKAIIFTIPNILRTPFISKASPMLEGVISPADAAAARSYYQQFNSDVFEWNFDTPGVTVEQRRPFIEFGSDASSLWAAVVYDSELSDATTSDGRVIPKIRQLRPEECVLPMFRNELGKDGFGTINPLENRFILTRPQLDRIYARLNEFNDIIRNTVSSESGVTVFDMDVFFDPFYTFEGVIIDGVPARPDFLSNGIFSSDGFFLNPRGQALLANAIVSHINNYLGGNIQRIDPNKYRGNVFRNGF